MDPYGNVSNDSPLIAQQLAITSARVSNFQPLGKHAALTVSSSPSFLTHVHHINVHPLTTAKDTRQGIASVDVVTPLSSLIKQMILPREQNIQFSGPWAIDKP